jgi:hypothetical protein
VSRALLPKRCIDCIAEGITTNRPLAKKPDGTLEPGPRCWTHHRFRRLTTKDKAWATRILQKYALTVREYWDIFLKQGERCVICERATGLRKHLSVDHDHATGFVRGLLCTPCNKMLGHLRDDPDAFIRAANYLLDPPAFAVIGRRVAPIEMKPKQPYVNRPNGRTS